MTSARLYGLDIETDTTIDGLDPEVAAIVAVAVVAEAERFVFTGAEPDILQATESLMVSLPPGVVVTWNGTRFDLPFLARRAALHDIALSLDLGAPHTERRRSGERWGHHSHVDALNVYRADVGRVFGLSCALKPLSKMMGFEPVEVDRCDITSLSADELERYVASDAELARTLLLRRRPTVASLRPPSD